ncbi:MAG: RsmE family RNA methyltransferase [Bacteroidia bacterium]|nr:RsmE family RNA methyltransferase [Bacteroidia bacterium]
MQIFLLQTEDEVKARLDEQESRHCIKVLRHTSGDEIHCIDGKGNMYVCRIEEANPKACTLHILSKVPEWGEKAGKIILAISPLRLKDRFEWALEKAVELGVDQIQPIICQRTDQFKSKLKRPRLETLLLTASKQCKRSRIPQLLEAKDFSSFVEEQSYAYSLMAFCESEDLIQHHTDTLKASEEICMIIGPEGDFSPEECEKAKKKGIPLISLGESRLRTETAAIYALSSLKLIREY